MRTSRGGNDFSMIDVCLLGNGGMMPLPDRPLSAVAFRVGSENVLFDCGEGTQVNWRASEFSYPSLGTILISHAHADHIAGLPGILFQLSFSGRTEPVTIYGPQWTLEAVHSLATIVGQLPFELQIVKLEGGETFNIGPDMQVSTLILEHRMPCLGYVIDVPRAPRFNPDRARELGVPMEHWKQLQDGYPVGEVSPEDVTGPPRRGLRLSLITDTRYFDGLVPFVEESDLLVCEAMFAEDEDTERACQRGHMTFAQATRLARDARVSKVWLTHFSPKVEYPEQYLERMRRIFPGVEIGTPGLKTTLAFVDE